MITLSNEFTDRKQRTARGWLFFDADCRFCTRIARWLEPILNRRGLAVAPLQDPRVSSLLNMSRPQLLKEIRFLDTEGTLTGGSRAVLSVAREIRWAHPLLWLASIPGMPDALNSAYKWIAARRGCSSAVCQH